MTIIYDSPKMDINCEGCTSACNLNSEQRRYCPCKECLVKVMCKTGCDDYKENRYLFG